MGQNQGPEKEEEKRKWERGKERKSQWNDWRNRISRIKGLCP